MPETGLLAVGALGGSTPFSRRWHGCVLSEAPDRAAASLATRTGQDEALSAAIASVFGATLPGPGRWTAADKAVFFWTGPGQWSVEADDDGPSLTAVLQRAVGDAASVVDQSDACACLHLAGPLAPAVLEKLCPLDLHPSVFPVGSVTRTLMEHLGVSIAVLDEEPRFALWVERSAARSFLHALVQAADSACGPG